MVHRLAHVIVLLVFAAAASPALRPTLAQTDGTTDPSGETILVTGVVRDATSGLPVSNADVSAWSDAGSERSYASATSNAVGAYEFSIAAGTITIYVSHFEYDPYDEQFYAATDTVRDVLLRPIPPKTATIQGVVTDRETQAPVVDAYVSVWRTYEPAPCEGDVCPGASSAASETRSTRPEYYGYDGGSATTGSDGQFAIPVYGGGPYSVNVWRDGYKGTFTTVTVEEGATRSVSIELAPIPPQSVVVTGTVTDAKTGAPVAGAYVSLENAEWQRYNSTFADENGRFSLRIEPGYTLLWVRAESYGPIAVATACPENADCAVDPPPLPPQSPDRSYYPWVESRTLRERETVELTVRLAQRPEYTATISGWIVDAKTQEGIAGAYVSVSNEDTRDWGYAQTDADGSYVIRAKPGFHVIYAGAHGYFQNALTTIVAMGENRVDILLEEGDAEGSPSIYYALEARAAGTGAPEDQAADALAPGSPGSEAAASFQETTGASGTPTYAGGAGGLGKYRPLGTSARSVPGFETLAAPIALVALAVLFPSRRR